MDSVIHLPKLLTNLTTSSFYEGDTLQHTTESLINATLKNANRVSSVPPKIHVKVAPSITIPVGTLINFLTKCNLSQGISYKLNLSDI